MKISYKLLSLLIAFVLLTTSCEENFLDVNEDPNNPGDATLELVFPAGVSAAAFTLGGQWQVLGSFWAQHWTQSPGANQYSVVDNYNITETYYDGEYTEMYAGALNDLNFVSKKAAEMENWNYFLMSEVMQAYIFQLMVDLYDKVPYFEALQGSDKIAPAFDEGQAIYDDLILRIDNALSKDREAITSTQPGEDDLLFKGDMEKWVQFANTLKLKIYMRQTEARPQVAQTGITALFNSGAQFLGYDAGEEMYVNAAMTDYVNVENFRNPYYAVQVSSAGNGRGNVDVAASNTLLTRLLSDGDPRLNTLFNTPEEGGGHTGLDQGDYTNPSFGTHSELSQPDIGPTHPVMFLSAAESKFLQAEAVARYGVAGNAQTLYNEGIEASFAMHGLTGASDLYGAGGKYAFDPANAIQNIIYQKWIALANFNSIEAYLEYLRTGYPAILTITPNNVTSNTFPRRLPYTSTEIANNVSNLASIGGQKTVLERVWWDPS